MAFFRSSGRIEGPGSTSQAFKLEGPLGSQDLPRREAAQPTQEQEVLTAAETVAESFPASGAPYAIRPR